MVSSPTRTWTARVALASVALACGLAWFDLAFVFRGYRDFLYRDTARFWAVEASTIRGQARFKLHRAAAPPGYPNAPWPGARADRPNRIQRERSTAVVYRWSPAFPDPAVDRKGHALWLVHAVADRHGRRWQVFVNHRTNARGGRDLLRLHVPLWAVCLAIAVVPSGLTLAGFGVRQALASRQHRRARAGLCRRCGYDLRGSPERCPECGESLTVRSHPNGSSAPSGSSAATPGRPSGC